MGMDLFPSSGIDPYHLNWWGWRTVGDLLCELNCDLESMAGSNDGDAVDEETAYEWGMALKTAVEEGRILMIEFEDSSFYGGKAQEVHVEGVSWPMNWSNSMSVPMSLVAEMAKEKDAPLNEEETYLAYKAGKARAKAKYEEKRALPQVVVTPESETGKWFLEVAKFFMDSEGFEQW